MTALHAIRSSSCVVALAAIAACTPAVASTPVTTAPATQTLPVAPATASTLKEVHWFRNSAEMRGIYLEVYHHAAKQLEKLASENAPKTWAVILDADETAIDNSTFEKELGTAPYTEAAWKLWVFRKAAPALPGAAEFTHLAHRLGGTVVIVTNRDGMYCDATRENLKNVGIEADLVLCRATTSDKNPRFQSVERGTASPLLPALKVLMWFGDNIQDFPRLTQSLRDGTESDYQLFGQKYFLLPNPMYGSWEKVPYR